MGILVAMCATFVILSLLMYLIGAVIGAVIGDRHKRYDIALRFLFTGLTCMLLAAASIAGAGILFVWTEALK